ncbi:PRC-barrel domain-containing protein [Lederbergia sp. NSJ-179]|uniref:PRC-barrel domain-containing protein n=1 Tax=Lederbergia sp. NSJ-179 TaxID=2931402 RepID=UPI001FD10963|nr:PRC-barrel domain-containing protein [Lederbergia sp. NSJ-179]MCJ7841782.1 PRC-barrel domain-containing protein [Lederbergia sp. NSJ-179]
MRTFSLLKDAPVYDKNGDLFGSVCDICIQSNGRVTHLLLQKKGLMGKKFLLPVERLTSWDENGIHLKDEELLSPYSKNKRTYTMTHDQPLAKIKTISQEGETLGLLDDVYFLEEMGTIVGYELTDGFFSDITKGKRIIRTSLPPKISEETIVMSVNKLRGGHDHDEMSELPK